MLNWWRCYLMSKARELALLAITIFEVVVNEAGCKRVFSFVKQRVDDRQNRLGIEKTEKITKVCDLPSSYTYHSIMYLMAYRFVHISAQSTSRMA
jgi:hypothetical protein